MDASRTRAWSCVVLVVLGGSACGSKGEGPSSPSGGAGGTSSVPEGGVGGARPQELGGTAGVSGSATGGVSNGGTRAGSGGSGATGGKVEPPLELGLASPPLTGTFTDARDGTTYPWVELGEHSDGEAADAAASLIGG